MMFVCHRAPANKAVALPFPFSCDVHFCMAMFVCLKYENSFETNMHTTISNGAKCNHNEKVKLGVFLNDPNLKLLCMIKWTVELPFDSLVTVCKYILSYSSNGNQKDTMIRVSQIKLVRTIQKAFSFTNCFH